MLDATVIAATKKILVLSGLDEQEAWIRLLSRSLNAALEEKGYRGLMAKLRTIEPDIVLPEQAARGYLKEFWETKRRLLQAFQCRLMLKALGGLPDRRVTVVDIGDSSGTHMRYLRELTKGNREIEAIGVNLDPRAVEKIRARGQKAVLCRGEELHRHLGGKPIDLFTSFETIEHLHNPALFLRRLARNFSCRAMVVTVPYQRRSRVGLLNVRQGFRKDIAAEEEHIFELCPDDWSLLMLHSGWGVVYSEVCRQYPVRMPLVSGFLARLWRAAEFEGFWGAVLEKNTAFADRYKDWEE